MSHEDEYLSVEELIEIQKEDTRELIQALLEDGSDPDALYEIEHHLFAEDFATLEKAVVEAFKMGFEVLEAEETEDEDEETTKRQGPAGGDGKPGVIMSIVEFLQGASKTKPLSRDDVADKLAERFPERPRKSMRTTCSKQIPHYLKKFKDIDVSGDSKNGFWIETRKKAESKSSGSKKKTTSKKSTASKSTSKKTSSKKSSGRKKTSAKK